MFHCMSSFGGKGVDITGSNIRLVGRCNVKRPEGSATGDVERPATVNVDRPATGDVDNSATGGKLPWVLSSLHAITFSSSERWVFF